MRSVIICFLIVLLLNGFLIIVNGETNITVDICIYGATSGGVIAAYVARKLEKSVLLIEPGIRIGGVTAGGLGWSDIGAKTTIVGQANDFYRRVGKHYGKDIEYFFEPKVALQVFNSYLKEVNLTVMYEHRLRSLKKESTRIHEVTLEHSKHPEKNTNVVVHAKMFIDASYEGDLMAKANVSYTVGRESNEAYNETFNGVQLTDKLQFPDGVDPYVIPGDEKSGLLWGISNQTVAKNGTGDRKIQAYNFRICLTNDTENKIDITPPINYDPKNYELFLRYINKSHATPDNFFPIRHVFPSNPNKTDLNNHGPFGTDMIGMNYEYPEGNYALREKIIRDHVHYNKGLLYFIGHDPRVPESTRKMMLEWGYPKDEFVENNHWTPQLYIRESRRMIGEYIMTEHNVLHKTTVDDGIANASYTMDAHNTQRIVIIKNGIHMVKNEGNVQVPTGHVSYPVSYRSITPKRSECTNLLVPFCLSSTHIAYGSIRMEPVFMMIGHASATAASLAIDNNIDVQKVDVSKIQKSVHSVKDKSI